METSDPIATPIDVLSLEIPLESAANSALLEVLAEAKELSSLGLPPTSFVQSTNSCNTTSPDCSISFDDSLITVYNTPVGASYQSPASAHIDTSHTELLFNKSIETPSFLGLPHQFTPKGTYYIQQNPVITKITEYFHPAGIKRKHGEEQEVEKDQVPNLNLDQESIPALKKSKET